MAKQNAVELARERILVILVEQVHFFLCRVDRTHVELTHTGNFHVATDLLTELFTVLDHRETELSTDCLFERCHVNLLACSNRLEVRGHTLIYFGFRNHNRIAVNAAEQNLFFNHAVQHSVFLLLFRHISRFGRFLEPVKVVHELRAHNRLAIDNSRNAFHQHRFGETGCTQGKN